MTPATEPEASATGVTEKPRGTGLASRRSSSISRARIRNVAALFFPTLDRVASNSALPPLRVTHDIDADKTLTIRLIHYANRCDSLIRTFRQRNDRFGHNEL